MPIPCVSVVFEKTASDDAVGQIGLIGRIGRRLAPPCATPCPSRACRALSVLRSLFSVLRGGKRRPLTLWKSLCYFMDVKASANVPLGVQPPTPPRARRIVPRLGPPGAGMERAWSFVRTFRPNRAVLPRPLAFFVTGAKKCLLWEIGVCYHMRRFPVGYQSSGQLGRTVNPLALPSYVRIVDPPPFFARGFGHGFLFYGGAFPRRHGRSNVRSAD